MPIHTHRFICLLQQGTVRTGAQFNVAVSIIPFSYFVLLTFKPEFNTLTWTLDYQYASDFGSTIFTDICFLSYTHSYIHTNKFMQYIHEKIVFFTCIILFISSHCHLKKFMYCIYPSSFVYTHLPRVRRPLIISNVFETPIWLPNSGNFFRIFFSPLEKILFATCQHIIHDSIF